jgi:acetyltransferase-like isoleucine patch superfamily enzyme
MSGVRAQGRLFWERLMRKVVYFWGPRLTSELRKRWVIFKNPHAEISFAGPCRLGPGFNLHMENGGRFVVGKYVDFRRGFLAEIGPDATVTIGDLCVFSYNSLIQCSTRIEIGDRAMFGQSSIVVDGNHRFRDISMPLGGQGYDYKSIKIANDATTLTKVTIVDSIGTKAVVGANSVVAKPIPPYCLAAGVPARVLDYFGPPELAPSEWVERRRAKGLPDPPARPGRLEVSGHSIAFGGGVSAFENRFTTKLADLLGVQEVNRAVSGAIACWHETGVDVGDGGYANVLQRFERPADVEATPPEPAVALTYYGVNDLGLLGPDNLAPFQHALRTAISRHRSSAVFEEDHESVTASGVWQARGADGPDCSGQGVLETREAGTQLAIEVPEPFPGGTVALGFVVSKEAVSRLALAVDGIEAAQLDTAGAGEPLGHRTGVVVRLPGLAPGAHKLTVTVAETTGPVAFDYWQVEPERGPTVLVPLAFKMRDWSHHYSDWPHQPGDTDVPVLNEAIRQVVDEFGDSVVAVELDPVLDRQERLFSWEGVYPNDQGHALIAEALLAAVPDLALSQKTGVSE